MKNKKLNIGFAIVLLGIGFINVGCATTDPIYTERDFSTQSTRGEELGNETPNVKTLYSMAKMYTSQEKYREGELILRRAIEEYPDFVPSYVEMANICMKKKRVKDARSFLQVAIQKNNYDPLILNNLGICELLLGDIEKAQDFFYRAAQLLPGEKRYVANFALTLGISGDLTESESIYSEFLTPEKVLNNINIISQLDLKE